MVPGTRILELDNAEQGRFGDFARQAIAERKSRLEEEATKKTKRGFDF